MEGRNKSTAYKQAFNEKAYDRLAITIPKGRKATVVELMKDQGHESINGLVNALLRGAAGLSEDEWKNPPVEKGEPIISAELFEQAQAVMKKKKGDAGEE